MSTDDGQDDFEMWQDAIDESIDKANAKPILPDELRTKIFQSLGAASSCWETLDDAGEFDSSRARQIGDELCDAVGIFNSQPRPLRVEVYEQRLVRLHDDRDDEPFTDHRFRVVHTSNGEILAHGEGYVDKRDRDHAVALLHPDLDVVEVEG